MAQSKVRILENELECSFSGGGDDTRCFQCGKGGTSLHVTLKTSCKLLLTWQREDTPPCHAKHLHKVFLMWQRRNTPSYYVEHVCNVFSMWQRRDTASFHIKHVVPMFLMPSSV